MSRAVFLDRDGTLNVDPGYLDHPDKMALIPGVGDALARLSRLGFRLIVVSNQSGVGRGLIDPKLIPAINARLNELIAPSGTRIERFEMCFLLPDDPASRRKPKPDLILDAARALGIDVSLSYMVGDKVSDIQAGIAAGCRASAMVLTGYGSQDRAHLKPGEAAYVGRDLNDVSRWIESETVGS
ncbi:MAG: HAD family hydrolase [Bdellovibrionales bacterium]|nr:HAD family hydrolase [Bdellovibrionales bacterium]